MTSDYLECLKTMMNQPKLSNATKIVKIAERVKRVLQHKHQSSAVMDSSNFPQLIERQTYKFTCINNNSGEEEFDSSSSHNYCDRRDFF